MWFADFLKDTSKTIYFVYLLLIFYIDLVPIKFEMTFRQNYKNIFMVIKIIRFWFKKSLWYINGLISNFVYLMQFWSRYDFGPYPTKNEKYTLKIVFSISFN